ncbi:Sugar fermentation stimulation protein B (modular protein) [Thiomonas sp. CB3]|nr:Sugar fermentation stimulation protein B (modular protein) [Thiomonas sp. CB3]
MSEVNTKQPSDWHPADIVAALKKAGWSAAALSRFHGYKSPRSLAQAIFKPWPKGQQLIADAIGVNPATIWPSRYVPKHRTIVKKTEVRSARKNEHRKEQTAHSARKAA